MQRNISWTNPTKYTDGTDIGVEKSDLFIHVWKDGAEVYQTLKNVTTFPIEVNRGQSNDWQLQAELNGQKSVLSPAISYTEPFQIPGTPENGKVS